MQENLEVFSMFPSVESAGRRFASLHRVRGASSPASTVLSKRYDFLAPVPPHFVAFVWRCLSGHSLFSLRGRRVGRRGLELVPGISSREVAEETTGSHKFLGNPNCPFAMFQRRRQDC